LQDQKNSTDFERKNVDALQKKLSGESDAKKKAALEKELSASIEKLADGDKRLKTMNE